MVIMGPNRGTSYAIQEGEMSIGRQVGNGVVLASEKVSKRHCVLVVSNGQMLLKDVGSSNGTFVNGALTREKRLKPGDRISVGEYIFEIVQPSVKAQAPAAMPAISNNVIRLPTGKNHQSGSQPSNDPGTSSSAFAMATAPTDLKGRILHFFDHRVMPFFFGLNLKNEWRFVCAGLLCFFVIGNLFISVQPLMDANRASLVKEIGKRAAFMAHEIAERNSGVLAQHMETKTEIGPSETAEGVRLATLTALDNRILAPATRMNQYLTNGVEARFAVRAKEMFQKGRETGLVSELDDSTIVAIEPVKVLDPSVGKNIVIGMAIVSIDSSLSTPDVGAMGVVYSEAFILTGLFGALIFFILYRMTLKPFQMLNEDMDKVLKGEMGQVTHEFKFSELDDLWTIINSALQRAQRSSSGLGGLSGEGFGGSSEISIDEYVGPAMMLGSLSKYGLVLFDSSRRISYLNSVFEEISGIRADGAIGQEMNSVARDQALGAFTQDLIDRASVGGSGVSEDFDFSGISYKVSVAAFGSAGGSPRGYLLVMSKTEGG